MAVPYGVVSVLQAISFFSFNVGEKYTPLSDKLGDVCQRTFPCLKSNNQDEDEDSEGEVEADHRTTIRQLAV